MIRKITALSILLFIAAGCADEMQTKTNGSSFEKEVTSSLVYINITKNNYSQLQPWKRSGITQSFGYGCAVADDQILTTAWNIAGAEYIKVKWAGQTEYVQASVKVIDYESDLCILSIKNAENHAKLVPLSFYDTFEKSAELVSYWISSTGTLLTGRGYLESAKVKKSVGSYSDRLNFIVSNSSSDGSKAKLFCMGNRPIGIASWSTSESKSVGLIPARTINQFLRDCQDGSYLGLGAVGFEAERLVDPSLRRYLKLDQNHAGGMLVSSVNTLGTGSDTLKKNDVILAMDGKKINSYGRYNNTSYGEIMYQHLITSKPAGQTIVMDVFRDGREKSLEVEVKNFNAGQMLVPYYEHSNQPEFLITGGFVFQKMTRPYLKAYGSDLKASIPPHLYYYYEQQAFSPTNKRRDIVILSFVLPADINRGYHNMRLAIVSTYNGMKISQISDIIEAKKLADDDKYDVVEFEQDYPTVVIDRAALPQADEQIAQRYGVTKMSNINP